MTKEELLIENCRLQNEVATLDSKDHELRKEFAKAFNWFKNNGSTFSHTSDPIPKSPTWPEIFVHIGYLKSKKDFVKQNEKIEIVELALQQLHSKITDINSPK